MCVCVCGGQLLEQAFFERLSCETRLKLEWRTRFPIYYYYYRLSHDRRLKEREEEAGEEEEEEEEEEADRQAGRQWVD